MRVKDAVAERAIILAEDHRRKYGARVRAEVADSACFGDLGQCTFQLPSGQLVRVMPDGMGPSNLFGYTFEAIGYMSAGDAEVMGMQLAQAVLLVAVSLDVGLRLRYRTGIPASVFDRTVSPGATMSATGVLGWGPQYVAQEFGKVLGQPARTPKAILSLELFAAARLEANERTRFVTAVSALEPLAEQADLGPEVRAFVERAIQDFRADSFIPIGIRQSLEGRLLQLRHESIRQSLRRLCEEWFPGDKAARDAIDRAYSLRSEILHEGRADPDLLLDNELQTVSTYLRRVYAKEFNLQLLKST